MALDDVTFRILGPLEIEGAGPLRTPKLRALLALLLLHPNRTLSRDQIVDALWAADAPAESPRLQQLLGHAAATILRHCKPLIPILPAAPEKIPSKGE